jgi:hypothetical protein
MDIKTKTVTFHDIPAQMQILVALLKEGVEILVVEHEGEQPIARLMLPEDQPHGRTPGLLPGSMQTSDDFDEPLPDGFWLGEDA